MPQVKGNKPFFSFVRGIITEANPLTYPEQASIDEANCVLKRDGSRERRLGMDYEEGYTLSSAISEAVFEDLAVSNHQWKNVGNDGSLLFSVVQTGTTIHFYDVTDADSDAISASKKSFTIDLNSYKAPAATNIGSMPIDAEAANGKLFIVSPEIEPIYVEYDSVGDSITVTQITLKIRDFEGLEDNLDTDERPTSLTDYHKYNLRNQGWSVAVETSSAASEDPITRTFSAKGWYPSNADVWFLAKDADEKYDPAYLQRIEMGNTPASRGHFILDLFERDRSSVSDVLNIPITTENGRPSTVAFLGGRVFYSGIDSNITGSNEEGHGGDLFYSQVLTSRNREGKCYQEADPSSEEINERVATDGGIIHIPEAGTIRKIERVGNSIVVFASNGVWEVRGNGEEGFSAISQDVTNITNISVSSPQSVVAVEGAVIFWADGGIYTATPSETTGKLVVKNISEGTIQTLYNNINTIAKEYSVGSYDKSSKQVSWLYNNDADFDGITYKYKYNKELVYDLVLQAFYVHTISPLTQNSPYVAGYLSTPAIYKSDVETQVVVGSDSVQDTAVDVVVSLSNPARGAISTKYLTIVPQSNGTESKLTYSSYKDTTFVDWFTADGVGANYRSYLLTGYDLFGDLMKDKQVVTLIMYFKVTETGYSAVVSGTVTYDNPSGCFFQTRWDWSTSAASNKWGTARQAYKLHRLYIPASDADTFDYGFEVTASRHSIRGTGKALSMYIYSEDGKDMKLLGWGVDVEAPASA